MIINMLKKNCLCVVIFLTTLSSAQVSDPKNLTTFYYPDSTVSSVGVLVTNKPDGVWKSYFQTGIIKSIVHWNNGKLHGLSSFFSEDSLLKKTIEYTNNLKNGYVTIYDSIGNLEVKLPYENDTLHGIAYKYYPDGKLMEEWFYEKGNIQGLKRIYDKSDGRLTEIKRFENDSLISVSLINQINNKGNKEGYWEEYNENGILVREGNYVNGKENGSFRVYDKYGRVVLLENYELGKQTDKKPFTNLYITKTLHNNGKIASQGPVKEGMKIGVYNYYDTLGYYFLSEVYKYDTLMAKGKVDLYGIYDSTWLFFHPNGKIKSTGDYKNGYKSGKWIFLYDNGKLAQQGNYREDKAHGYWIWYYKNGQVRTEENYYRGKLQGDKIEYDSLGKIITKGHYIDDYKDGEWFYYVGDHKETGKYIMGMKEGIWTYYFEDNIMLFKGEYKNDTPVGKHKEWYRNGKIKEVRRYKPDGKAHGRWKKYKEDGDIEYRLYYKKGNLVNIDGDAVGKN